MSPSQLHKQLRLQEVPRLMLSKGLDAASTNFRVRYADASHFTRAYK
jgi:AraC-like DNA-binding protein